MIATRRADRIIDESLLIARAMRERPIGRHVVAGSTAVTSFGDPRTARVASIGINPSVGEFCNDARPRVILAPGAKRFVDYETLGVDDGAELSEAQAHQVVEGCHRYFSEGGNPYQWFTPMQKWVLDPLGASYRNGSAVHLDLVQWATDPVWDTMPPGPVKDDLLRDDLPFLKELLGEAEFELVVLNGRTVVDTLRSPAVGLFNVTDKWEAELGGSTKTTLWRGTVAGMPSLGWSKNVPSPWSAHDRPGLANWLSRSTLDYYASTRSSV